MTATQMQPWHHQAHGITVIDTGFARTQMAASYLLKHQGRGVFIETGTSLSLARFLSALDALEIARTDVDYVMVTHVHLDHAGGAGSLLKELPNAKFVVHPRGARHMIDPSKLIGSATMVYGEEIMRQTYGAIVPIAAERIIEAADNFVLDWQGRTFTFFDTPGHARHHVCIHDSASNGIFTGDTFGLSYREFDSEQGPFVFPTTTPVQFDPAALRGSIERLLAQQPAAVYLTHYGRIDAVQSAAKQLLATLDAFVALAEATGSGAGCFEQLCDGIRKILLQGLREHGCPMAEAEVLALLDIDIQLNAQGIEYWLKTRG